MFDALCGHKGILHEERPVITFAYAGVVTIAPVREGDMFSPQNVWVKRPGTGEILARDYDRVLGKRARRALPANVQLRWSDVAED